MDNNFENNEVLEENAVSEEQFVAEEEQKESKLGLISMILAIASVVVCCCGVGNLGMAISAIVIAIVEKNRLGKFSKMGKAGLIIAILYFVISLISGVIGGAVGLLSGGLQTILETNYHF